MTAEDYLLETLIRSYGKDLLEAVQKVQHKYDEFFNLVNSDYSTDILCFGKLNDQLGYIDLAYDEVHISSSGDIAEFIRRRKIKAVDVINILKKD